MLPDLLHCVSTQLKMRFVQVSRLSPSPCGLLSLSLLYLVFSLRCAAASSPRFAGDSFGVAWVSDVHLDPLYSPVAHIEDWCRPSSSRSSSALLSPSSLDSGAASRQKADAEQSSNSTSGGESRSRDQDDAKRAEANSRDSRAQNAETLSPLRGWRGAETNPNIGRAGCDSSPLLFRLLLDSVEREIRRRKSKDEKATKPQTSKELAEMPEPKTEAEKTAGAQQRELSDAEEDERRSTDWGQEREEERLRNTPIEAVLFSGDFAAHYDDSESQKRMAAIKMAAQAVLSRFAPASPSSSSMPSARLRRVSASADSGEHRAEAEARSGERRKHQASDGDRDEGDRDEGDRDEGDRDEGLAAGAADSAGDRRAGETGTAASATPVQVIFVVGNNDLPRDYHIPETLNKWSVALYKLWRPILPGDPQTKETFERGLFYRTRLATRPSVRVLCLNTVFYARMAREREKGEEDLVAESDPAGQFAWMARELQDARELQEQVLLVGHVPPGVSVHFRGQLEHVQQWRDAYLDRYRSLVLNYSDVIVAHLYGHVHADTLRVISPDFHPASASLSSLASLSSSPASSDLASLCRVSRGVAERVQPLLTAPAVSPVHGNNPAWKILFFSDSPLEAAKSPALPRSPVCLLDYTQLYLPLYGFIPRPVTGASAAGLAETSLATPASSASSASSADGPANRAALRRETSAEYPFLEEYTFSSTYGLPCVSGPTVARLSQILAVSPFVFGLYSWHSESGGREVTNRLRVCEGVVSTRSEYLRCLRELTQL
uniref:Acid sphingomyelinase-like phosphodiesterase 3b n=1 Tax=Toxoplasma gondii (strain ATCC 50861 / VEG) TaxID=432359 RepID=A0A0F7V224_TOXGV|nr:TPA: Acid sphingomyelinase-like phosphodiesterase 3b [Toxoplasma gondii VEG]